jgi:hypothetical protein
MRSFSKHYIGMIDGIVNIDRDSPAGPPDYVLKSALVSVWRLPQVSKPPVAEGSKIEARQVSTSANRGTAANI